MSDEPRSRDPYLVKSIVHSSQLLKAFRASGEALPLREVAKRSGLPKSMAFRLLYTLEKCGMVEKVERICINRAYGRSSKSFFDLDTRLKALTISFQKKYRLVCSARRPLRESS